MTSPTTQPAIVSPTTSAGWPAEALADPPEYPFRCDRHGYSAPGMEAWRATHHGGSTVGEVDDLDLRNVRRDVGARARGGTVA